MPNPPTDIWLASVSALLSAGGLKFAYDAFSQWRSAPPRALRQNTVVDASIATVARARDELEADLANVRSLLADERKARAEDEARHTVERARWLSDQERLRADVNRLEERLRAEQAEASARYDALLEQVHRLRLRSETQEGPQR